jgi:hypothetical protein
MGSAYAGRASGYLREGYGGVNVEKILTYAVLAGVVYFGWKIYKGTKAVADFAGDAGTVLKAGTDAVGGAIGRGLYDLFHPDQDYSGVSGYVTYFTDSKTVAYVDKKALDADGGFAVKGKFYDLIKMKTPVPFTYPNGKKIATAYVAKRVM